MTNKEAGWDQHSLGQPAASPALGPLSPSAKTSLLSTQQPLGVVLNQNLGCLAHRLLQMMCSGSAQVGITCVWCPPFCRAGQRSAFNQNIFLRGFLKALGWCCTALPAPQVMFARKSAAFVLSELVNLGNQLKAFQFGDPFLINS